jgi:HAD superfamily hydrolase (TIGR01459 family)
MPKLEFKKISELMDDYDLFLFDLWGVVIEAEQIYPGVIDTINEVMSARKVFFVSNAPRPALKVAANLRKWGISQATDEMVITSGDISRKRIDAMREDLGGRLPSIYHLGADRNEDLLSNFACDLTENLAEADVLLMSLFRDDHENLTEFDDLLKEAASLNIKAICANPDVIIPKFDKFRYGPGYFAEKLEKFGGEVFCAGKPGINIYEEVFERSPKISKNRILMVGDTYETDILGGNNAGIHTALVMTGNADKFHKGFDKIEDKLQALYDNGLKSGAVPSLVTKLA